MAKLILFSIFFFTLFARRFFAKIEFFSNIYIYELFFCFLFILLLSQVKFEKKILFKKIPLRYLLLIVLAGYCFSLAIFKCLSLITDSVSLNLASDGLREVVILFYPIYFVILLVYFFTLNKTSLIKFNNYVNISIFVFPIFCSFLYFTKYFYVIIDENGNSLWPNNNFILVSVLLALFHYQKKFTFSYYAFSIFQALTSMLFEAQRGILVILLASYAILIRKLNHLKIVFFLFGTSFILIFLFGSYFSPRFSHNPSNFVTSTFSLPSTSSSSSSDIRYSSTETRIEMWKSVLSKVNENTTIFFIGMPLHQKIISNHPWAYPHNGYLSAIARGGILTLFCYLLFLLDSIFALQYTKTDKIFSISHYVYFGACIDAFTQTVFDSPYSLILLMFSAALSITIRMRI